MKKQAVQDAASLEVQGAPQPKKPVKRFKKPSAPVEPEEAGVDAMTPTDRLKEVVDAGLKEVDAALRKFQKDLADINTDAGYEVKRAADYFLQDIEVGTADVMESMVKPDYEPNAFGADVLAGRIEDEPLIAPSPPPLPKAPKPKRGERSLNEAAIEDEIAVDGEMLMERN